MFFCFGVTSTSLQFILLFHFLTFSLLVQLCFEGDGEELYFDYFKTWLIMLMRVIWYSTINTME